MSITVDGELPAGVTAKDVVLSIIARIGTGGGIGSIIEYRGSAIRALSMEGRMTVCNMSIEAGARAGMIAPDDTTFAYVEGRPFAPKGKAWEQALDEWRSLPTDSEARVRPRGRDRRRDAPAVGELGHQPRADRDDRRPSCPDPTRSPTRVNAESATHALRYMGLKAGHADARHHRRHRVHRLVHERPARGPARRGRRRPRPTRAATGMRALVVPGSMRVKAAAEAEGLDRIFTAAGFEWREPAARCASR